jgi:hypothetical protein
MVSCQKAYAYYNQTTPLVHDPSPKAISFPYHLLTYLTFSPYAKIHTLDTMWYTLIYCIYTSNIFIHVIYFIFSILYLKVEFLNLPW